MKRAPLTRKMPLKSKALKALRRKPKAKISEAELAEMAAFKAAIAGARCVVCGASEREARERTRVELGYPLGLQAHHAIRQQVLRRLRLPLWDVRLAVPVCEEPCHRRHTSRKRRILVRELPLEVFEFVAEFGLQAELTREYPA